MRRALRWMVLVLALFIGLPLLAVALGLYAANTQPGRDWIERTVATLTAGETMLTGLSGHFPDALRIRRLELRDAGGVWLAIDDLALDWSPLQLLAGTADIGSLQAGHIALDRLPPASGKEESASSLPVGVILRHFRVTRLDLAEPVAGKAASLAIDGKADLASLQQGEVVLSLKRLDGDGAYALQGSFKDGKVRAHLTVQEPAHGLISSYANFQGMDALSAEADMDGPLSALQTRLSLALGPLQTSLQGLLDLEHNAADVTVSIKAPAMQLRPDLSWRAITVEAKMQGPFTRPNADGTLRIDSLNAAGAAVRSIAMAVQGNAGALQISGELAGLRLPGPHPDLLEAAPLALQADIRLDAPSRPVAFKLKHPLVTAEGKALTDPELQADMAVALPNLKPLAALGGLDIQGKADFSLRTAVQGESTKFEADGNLAVTGGDPLLAKGMGNAAKIGIAATLRGEDISLSRFALDGKAVAVSADGKLVGQVANFNWKLALKDLAVVMDGGTGQLTGQGQLIGPVDKFAVTADLTGELASKELPRGPITVKLRLDGLPRAPIGQFTVRGALGGAPIDVTLNAKAPAEGSLQVMIDSATWKSAQAKGMLTLPKGADLPFGKIDLALTHLEDVRPFIGQPLTGSVNATLETSLQGSQPVARVQVDARHAGLADTATVGQTLLNVTLFDPIKRPVIDGHISLDGIASGKLAGSAQLELAGPVDAVRLRWSANVQPVAGAEVGLHGAASLDAKAKQATVAELEATWKSETLRLLAPVRIAFADGLLVDRLRLGLREAELAVAGRFSPTLGLTATLHHVPASLASLVAPDLAIAGTLEAEANLTGLPTRPSGDLSFEATDIRLQTGEGRALPPIKVSATARLGNATAAIDGRLSAGNANLTMTGDVPMNPSGQLGLHAAGSVDLKLLDPLLTAAGRRLRGQLLLNADLAGTLSEPRPTGSVQLTGGEMQDFAIGAHLSQITGLLLADGGTVRISKLEGRAGQGTVSVGGSVDLLGEGMPVNLTLTARKSRPLADDQMTVNLNTDLTLKGQAKGQLAIAGAIHINRADIRIPERMPAKIAVLKVIRPGQAPPPPPPPAPNIALDLTMDAPREIFVRGRGLDAELGGKIHVRGTLETPQPDGGFALRRGQFELAGQSLTFSKGEVGFNGGSLADPSLNFVANTTSGNVTATLTISGMVSDPKIKLSSVPELPQDEVLARLLFGRGTASLGPLEMVQIAAAVGSLTGVTSAIGDPLETVRKGLGLDRLSIGGANPSLEAGRYVAPGVYVGAKQGVTGTGTQATVQIDVIKGLKVEGTAGTGAPASGAAGAAGTNSVGVIYQHEY
ncbi:MAG: translocation/assembly module TamB domain-containing protein [Candidatus Methylumidiphilus sp.]